MAETQYSNLKNIDPEKILNQLFLNAVILRKDDKKDRGKFFLSEGLEESGDQLSSLISDNESLGNVEMQRLAASKKYKGGKILLGTLPQDIKQLKDNLKQLESYYIHGNTSKREEVLVNLVYLGQELLRRRYLAKIMEPEKDLEISDKFNLIEEFGAAAIQVLGKAPRPPIYKFKKFSSGSKPIPRFTGIEILSSGAFPDWFNDTNKSLRNDGKVKNGGFENVLDAAFDTPRSRVLARAIKENRFKNIFSLPSFMRTMLDLELMRLGQATTPGTFSMLLNSYYYGAMLCDHSTNVSEQVQIIYDEEDWKPIYKITGDKPSRQAAEVNTLLYNYFLTKKFSPVKMDHPRTARIEFSQDLDPEVIKDFFITLKKLVNQGKNGDKLNDKVHEILPVVRFSGTSQRLDYLKSVIIKIKSAGYKKIALMADYIKHCPGLLQYFNNADDTNKAISFALKNKVSLIDGRTVDMIATSNKAIEAAAGAIMSGHGCIKVGLLGLTYEQMSEFIIKFKRGLGTNYKRRNNQVIIFIGLVDEPIVSQKIHTNAREISEKFIDLMRKRKHDILLLDTMHKGEKDKRLINERDINKKDKKGGHLTFNQLKALIRKANKQSGGYPGCELWVAGSYTEGQTYQASLAPLKERPGLICLGGAERSFGGIRLDPKNAYEINEGSRNKKEKELAALIQFDSDIKFLLSRDNKLARDAGHVEGELRRRRRKEALLLKKLRQNYLKKREIYYTTLQNEAEKRNLNIKNIDTLVRTGDKFNTGIIKKAQRECMNIRNKYVDEVARLMYELLADELVLNLNTE